MSTRFLPLSAANRDIVRLAVQAAVAGTLAFLAVRLTGTGEAFLAVISAVFVLQPNRDATLESAGSRVLATLVGTAVGIAALALARDGAIPWPLALAMLVMGGLAAWKPSLRYGVVAAAGLAVGSEGGFLETARDRSIAIFLGAGIGIATGWLVWPEGAAARARRQIAEALSICRELLERTLDEALTGEEAENKHKAISRLHSRFAARLATARETAQSIGAPRHRSGAPYRDLVHRTERLWHALIILDRVGERTAETSLDLAGETKRRLDRIRRATCDALACAAAFERIPEQDLEALEEACTGAWSAARREGHSDEALPNAALIFGLGEVSRNVREIDSAIGAIRDE